MCTGALFAREVINLNHDWNFTHGYEVDKNKRTLVTLPHTWNQDALAGQKDYYRGIGIYEKKMQIPENWKGKCVYLRFKGVNTAADVLVNGKHVADHRGGYTAFAVDLTDRLNYGKENTILVYANNAKMMDLMPLVGDFNMYGGIYRDVEMIVTDQAHIAVDDYASSGVRLAQSNVSAESAQLDAIVQVRGKAGQTLQLTVQLEDEQGKKVLTKETTVVTDAKGKGTSHTTLSVTKPHLWNGTADPYLYRVYVIISHNNIPTDTVIQNIGFRTVTVDPDKGFFLNGKHLRIQGVCRHQDRAEVGNALYPIHHQEDIRIMREMGVNAIRLAHYPQDSYIYDLCDREGIIVWAEIPFVGPGGYRDKGFNDSEAFRMNGRQQLIEMIRQHYNHPSICMWGMFNELKSIGDNPTEYVEELIKLSHKEDPTRLTTCAHQEGDGLEPTTDLDAWNIYYGWYGGKPSGAGTWADYMHKKYPKKCIGISEYGAGASVLHQQEELKQPKANSYWHPENWQAYYHEENWKAIAQRPFIWGTFVWNMFDFGAAHRTEGEIPGRNDKGLVTFDRKYKKDAFYFYKANWNHSEPFVYIAERRLTERKQPRQTIKVYSNQAEVELFVNGKSLGKKKGESGIFLWTDVPMQPGKNQWRAVSGKGKNLCEDSITPIRL